MSKRLCIPAEFRYYRDIGLYDGIRDKRGVVGYKGRAVPRGVTPVTGG